MRGDDGVCALRGGVYLQRSVCTGGGAGWSVCTEVWSINTEDWEEEKPIRGERVDGICSVKGKGCKRRTEYRKEPSKREVQNVV